MGTRIHPVFSTSERAIVLEGPREQRRHPVGLRIDDEVKAWQAIAEAQGWEVSPTSNQRLRWIGPDGEGPVFTQTRMHSPADRANNRRQLERAGLKLEAEPKRGRTTTVDVAPMDALDIVRSALEQLEESESWQQLAQDAERDKERLQRELDAANEKLVRIRTAFDAPPWEVMGQIAKVLGLK